MINIVITAGGTSENIDEVRQITNTSTGTLGSEICKEIELYLDDREFTIHYIIGNKAVMPENKSKNILFYPITDTKSLINCIDGIFKDYKIDYFIHAMAVSDFTASYAISYVSLAKEIALNTVDLAQEKIEERVKSILKNPKNKFESAHKISSKEDILVGLNRAPKVIKRIKKIDDTVFLVGFKLLNNVSEQRLIEVARKLGEDNKCDLVLGNDISHINDNIHKGILLEKGKVIERYSTKEEIAKGLVMKMLGESK